MRDLIDPKTKFSDVFRGHDHSKVKLIRFCHDASHHK